MRRASLLVLLPLAFLGACDSDPAVPLPPPALLPLEVGHRLIFELTASDGAGDVTAVERDTVTVVGDTVLTGGRWYVLSGSSRESQAGFGGLNTVREDGVWFRGEAESPPFLQYAYPAEPGASYPYSPYRYEAEATLVSTETAGARQGHLYSIRFVRRKDFPVAYSERVPPLRRVLVPGVGFDEYETQWWVSNADGDLVVSRALSWRLLRFEPAGG